MSGTAGIQRRIIGSSVRRDVEARAKAAKAAKAAKEAKEAPVTLGSAITGNSMLGKGTDYDGRVAKTADGQTCKMWKQFGW